MAAPMTGANRQRFRYGRYQRMHEINVTPFVDVMLVLLVVFMVTAPLLSVGVPIDLPETKAPPLTEPDEPLEVTVDSTGKVYLQETEITVEALVPRLLAITENNPEARIYVRGDQAINYGRVLEVMGLITNAGFKRLALVSAPALEPRKN